MTSDADGSGAPDQVLVEKRGSVLLITLNRPAARNALNQVVTDGLWAAVRHLDTEDDLRVGVLIGAGGYFCAGVDLKALAKHGLPSGLGRLFREGSPRKPIIAAVAGGALAGGLELALACDLIVAAPESKFGIPEARVGLAAAGGGLVRLPQRLPIGIAMEMALTGQPISAERGYGLGLINRLCTAEENLLPTALDLAGAVAECAPLSLAASRTVLRASPGRTEEELWQFQKPLVMPVLRSSDAIEGARAFAEKRAPQWTAT